MVEFNETNYVILDDSGKILIEKFFNRIPIEKLCCYIGGTGDLEITVISASSGWAIL